MADNTIINPGSGGDAIATDDIGGVKFQRVKVTHGADGSATDVSSASPLPVDTELPAAAALSDSTANPTAPMVGAAGMVWDGANWERQGTVPNFTAVSPYRAAATLPLVMNGAGNVLTQKNAAAVSDGEAGNNTVGAQGLYNGASFDRRRGNTEGTLLASAARTTSVGSAAQTNHNARGVRITVYVTAKAAATNLALYLSETKAWGNAYIMAIPVWTAGASKALICDIYPGVTPAAMA